jgi:hypothetical protein
VLNINTRLDLVDFSSLKKSSIVLLQNYDHSRISPKYINDNVARNSSLFTSNLFTFPSLQSYSTSVLVLASVLFMIFVVLASLSLLFTISSLKPIKEKIFHSKNKVQQDQKSKPSKDSDQDTTGTSCLLNDSPVISNEKSPKVRAEAKENYTKEENSLFCIDTSVCPNIEATNREKKAAEAKKKKFNDKSNVEYLYDSPILVRKLYESNDSETTLKYAKKYNLEYLFDSDAASNVSNLVATGKTILKDSSTLPNAKKTKKITFKLLSSDKLCDEKSETSKVSSSTPSEKPIDPNQSYYYNLHDDDFILPNLNTLNRKQGPNASDQCEIASPTQKRLNKNSQIPKCKEDDIWVKQPANPVNKTNSLHRNNSNHPLKLGCSQEIFL